MTQPARILVVDDEPNVRLMVSTALELAGYEVAEAPGACQAIDSARTFSPDLILLDLKLPGVSGLEALEALRQATNAKSPVIVFTAHGSVPDAVAALKNGATDFVTKPLTPDVLRRVVHEALTHRATAEHATSRRDDNSSQISDHLASARRALGQHAFADAELQLRRALALDPNLGEAHHLLELLSMCEHPDPAPFEGFAEWFPTSRPPQSAR